MSLDVSLQKFAKYFGKGSTPIPIMPFLREKAHGDQTLANSVLAISHGGVPNTVDWHERFGTNLPVVTDTPVDGRRLFSTDEAPNMGGSL